VRQSVAIGGWVADPLIGRASRRQRVRWSIGIRAGCTGCTEWLKRPLGRSLVNGGEARSSNCQNALVWDMNSLGHISDPPPRIVDVYETVLYGSSIDALAAFYCDVIGLTLIEVDPELFAALRLPRGGVLLVFDPATAAAPGRQVPSHGAEGPGHVAFRVENLDAWREHLTAHRVAIEREIHWEAELASIYVRDPAGNSVELANGELWE
jgi:catechol 2,3-dioxygenase-like lactoylglutathione lyase family enzyme